MAPWLRFLEAYMVQALLRTPAFHRAVEKVAQRVHRLRHGQHGQHGIPPFPPQQPGGTDIDGPPPPADRRFRQHFLDEVKTQIGAAERSHTAESGAMRSRGRGDARVNVRNAVPDEEDSDAAWQNRHNRRGSPPKTSGFLHEYMDALREQVRNQQKGS